MKVKGWLVHGEAWHECMCEFDVDPDDPFAVTAVFAGVGWRIGRDLLRTGLDRPTGQGDVRIWPTHGVVAALFIQLRAPAGEALVELPRSPVREFLASLPPIRGVDEAIDAELRQMLDGS